MAIKYYSKKTVPYNFGDKHKDYIRDCVDNVYNIAEGAVRAGKTVDNVYAFAHELKTCPDKIHLATGSTAANAKLNIGDANGFGLESIFRGQCKWGKYKGNECLVIKGPSTNYMQKVVIFSGAALANSFKKIRGNSYGMWIATEINLHHDNTIKEAFNRTLASKHRKFFWDLNPDHPKAKIYTDYIDKYIEKAKLGELLGGVNYKHFTIFDNANISKESRDAFLSQYEKGSIWYQRDIEGVRCVAEGLIYTALAAEYASRDIKLNKHYMSSEDANRKFYKHICIGVDFGGNESAHAFSCSGITQGYKELVALASERHSASIDPTELEELIVNFCKRTIHDFGKITVMYCDSAEPVLIRGIKKAMVKAGLSYIKVKNARKDIINNRIFALASLFAQDRFYYTEKCESLLEALGTAVWDSKKIDKTRLDDGTSDIDSLDAFEYSFERDIKLLIPNY